MVAMAAAIDGSTLANGVQHMRQRDAVKVVVPYQSSITFVSVFAIILSPLATLLWAVHNANHNNDDYMDIGINRLLQDDNETSVTIASEIAKSGSCEVQSNQQNYASTWLAIQTTFYIAFAVGCFCLIMYECFRRDPIIGKYVYDRKRLTQPDRTPPPLMLSRSLWRGYDGDEEQGGGGCTKSRSMTCCRVRPAILEFIFLVLDDNYIRYSHASNEARKAREEQGIYSCCRSGRYHANCFNRRQLNLTPGYTGGDNDRDYFVDEDNYMFYADYSREYSHTYQNTRTSLFSFKHHQVGGQRLIRSWPCSDASDGNAVSPRKQWRHTVDDLFPEDDRRRNYAATRERTCNILRAGFDLDSGHPLGQAELELDHIEVGDDSGHDVELVSALDIKREGNEDSDKERKSEIERSESRTSLRTSESSAEFTRISAGVEQPQVQDGHKLDSMEGANKNENEGTLGGAVELVGEEKEDSVNDDEHKLDPMEGGNENENEGTLGDTLEFVGEEKGGCDNDDEHKLDFMEGGNDDENEGTLGGAVELAGEEKEDNDNDGSKCDNERVENSDEYGEFLGYLNSPASKGNASFYSAKSELDEEEEPNSTAGDNDKQEGEPSSIPGRRETGLSYSSKSSRRREGMNAGRIQALKYPHRLKYFFMPPGFHSWTNALDFIGAFFFIPGMIAWLKEKVSGLPTPVNKRNVAQRRNGRISYVDLQNPGKDLTEGEKELLRCAGLDTYLLVRLARFGFDVTFYPFISAIVTVLPIYYSCNTEKARGDDFLSLTIYAIPEHGKEGSYKMVLILLLTSLLYLYIMRRLWLEWEVFIKLRHSYLANGDTSAFDKSPTYLRKFRNTCIVECVPKSYRSDKNLMDVFESLYPGQVEHAEMLIDTSKLSDILKERLRTIERYDAIDARYHYEQWLYKQYQKDGKARQCCRSSISEPKKPLIRKGHCTKEKVDALDFLGNKIDELDAAAEEEYDRVIKLRLKCREGTVLSPREDSMNAAQFAAHNLYQLFVPNTVRKLFGEESEFFHGTGTVTFKSIATKQSAVQCNLSGKPFWMEAEEAPDPRDIFWANVGVDRKILENRRIIAEAFLGLGVLAWGVIVTVIETWTEQILGTFESLAPVMIGLVEGYIPALVVSLVLLWIPNLFFALARHVIRFKSRSRCDEFAMKWNTAYRLANIFFTFFAMSLLQAIDCFKEDPETFVRKLSEGIVGQSAALMNLMILATGQETMLQLLQWRSLLKQALFRPLINLNARSRRYIDWLNAAPPFEESFIFGFFAPVLSYGLMIAMIFAFMSPVMLGVCGAFFWTASKVHAHNALFVYCQRCESGGKVFYYWNRIVFITLYTSIVIFSSILTLMGFIRMAGPYLVIMTLIVFCMDKSVENTFVVHSLHLPISIARIHDEEQDALLAESNVEPDGGENFMYRHPMLDQTNWNSWEISRW